MRKSCWSGTATNIGRVSGSMVLRIDSQLDHIFLAFERQIRRRDLFKGAAALALAVAGLGLGNDVVRAQPSQCGSNWGRCGGRLCCSSYGGCATGHGKCFCGPHSNCYSSTAGWERCCNSYWLYQWIDCCNRSVYGGCCQRDCCYGSEIPCDIGGTCQSSAQCQVYCSPTICYCCTYRVLLANAC